MLKRLHARFALLLVSYTATSASIILTTTLPQVDFKRRWHPLSVAEAVERSQRTCSRFLRCYFGPAGAGPSLRALFAVSTLRARTAARAPKGSFYAAAQR